MGTSLPFSFVKGGHEVAFTRLLVKIVGGCNSEAITEDHCRVLILPRFQVQLTVINIFMDRVDRTVTVQVVFTHVLDLSKF